MKKYTSLMPISSIQPKQGEINIRPKKFTDEVNITDAILIDYTDIQFPLLSKGGDLA